MRAAKGQASLRIRAVSPEPSLLAHTSSESRGTFRQKARSLAPLNVWACAVKICHDGMLEDTNSLDGAHLYTGNGNHLISLGQLKSFGRFYGVFPFRLLPFCLLLFRLLSNFTSFPFHLQLIFVPAFDVVMVKHARICITV